MEAELKKTDADADGSGKVLNKFLTVAIRVIVSAFVLYFIISLVQWQNIIIAYKTADSRFIVIAGLLLFINIGIRTFKWRTMLFSVKETPSLREAFGSVMLGISLGSFTPGEIGDFAGRALHITDAKRSHLVGLTLLDKAQIFIVSCSAGIFSVACLTSNNTLFISAVAIVCIILSIVIVMRLGMIATLGHRLNASFFRKSWLTKVLDGFSLLNPPQLFTTVLCTFIFHGTLILQMYFLINGFANISLMHAFIGTSAMLFVKSLLPISIADLGIREAGSIFFFSPYGISQAAALNAALMLFLINILIPSIIGTYFIRHQQLSTYKFIQFREK